ncbi:MAG: (d)CMP kinase [Bacilli bacterium]|nr:(d)CMP kinase [Bacilli bacterium]
MENIVIAIDGPAGSGKGTVTEIIAKKLNLLCIDTGATYRAIALNTLRHNIDLNDTDKIIELAKKTKIEMDEEKNVYLNGEDVTKEIRSKEVSDVVSPLSNIKEVREILVNLQREIAKGKNVILEGRDTTTVIFPNAKYKFYLDATLEERVKRRYLQNKELGIDTTMEEVEENIKKRDYNDIHKEVGALKRTDDQIYIDTTNMSIDEVVDKIISYIEM